MSEVPVKVLALIASEIGITLGMGLICFYSLRAAIHATATGNWKHLRDL